MESNFSEVKAMLKNPVATPAGGSGLQQTSSHIPQGYTQSYTFRPYRGRGRYMGGQRLPIRPSLTGGNGFVDNAVSPVRYRSEDYGSNVPVRPAIPLTAPERPPPHAPSVSACVKETPSKEDSTPVTYTKEQLEAMSKQALAASAAAEEQKWWSPGMESPVFGHIRCAST